MARPPDEFPTKTEGKDGHTDYKLDHPAFGQLRAARVSGGHSTLYGSDFKHHNYVTIELCESTLHRGLSHDHQYGGKTIVELNMSEAQWATFVSAMNVGSGVPVTIRHRHTEGFKHMPGIMAGPKLDAYKGDIETTVAEAMRELADAEAMFEDDAHKMSAAVRDRMRGVIHQLKMKMQSSFPFIVKSLHKEMESAVEKAKSDVHAYAIGEINRMGMEALQSMPAPEPPIMVEDKTPKKKGVTIIKKGESNE